MVSSNQPTEIYVRRICKYVTVIAVMLLLDPRYSFHSRASLFASASYNIPENQNLDPNDQSPGTLVLPKNYKHSAAALPAKIQPGDLTDDQINVKNYHYRNNPDHFLWENPPCEWYHEKHNSDKNERRQDGCDNIGTRLYYSQEKEGNRGEPISTNCTYVYDTRCFQFRGHRGRCYMLVRTTFDPWPISFKWVLVNDCD